VSICAALTSLNLAGCNGVTTAEGLPSGRWAHNRLGGVNRLRACPHLPHLLTTLADTALTQYSS
jgi:hypothetical protein